MIPGRTDKTRAQRSGYTVVHFSTSGRGPTMLISPRSTFRSCGVSSSLLRRSHRPRLVTLAGEPRSNRPFSAAASSRIERNLSSRNGRPPRPIRNCRKRTGPGEVVFTRMASRSMAGARRTIAEAEIPMSMARFMGSPCGSATERWAQFSVTIEGFEAHCRVRDFPARSSSCFSPQRTLVT